MKNACYVVVARRKEEDNMYSKNVNVICVGTKRYTKKTEEGKEYTIKLANVVYNDPENKNLTGRNVASVKTNCDMEHDKTYEVCIVTQKVNDKYYQEIVSAKAIK